MSGEQTKKKTVLLVVEMDEEGFDCSMNKVIKTWNEEQLEELKGNIVKFFDMYISLKKDQAGNNPL